MNHFGIDEEALFEAARNDLPSAADRLRLKHAVLARVSAAAALTSAGAAAATGSSIAPTAAATATLLGAKFGVVGVAGLLIVGGSLGLRAVTHKHDTRDSSATTHPGLSATRSPSASAGAHQTRTALLSEKPVATPTLAPTAVPEPHAVSHAVERDTEQTIEPELPLLQAAQAALHAGDYTLALRRLDEHARRFPAGAFAEERRALHAIALCQLNRNDSARREAEAFLHNRPASPLVERVRASCMPNENVPSEGDSTTENPSAGHQGFHQ